MRREDKTDTFSGKIGENIPSTYAEMEEDLLETLYLWWRSGKPITALEVCMKQEWSRRELNTMLRNMAAHGYLRNPERNDELELTAFGKAQGAECLERHRYLTQFLQMVCGLGEEVAQENACRIEHVVSGEVIEGIREFLKFGDIYDRVVHNLDLYSIYETGRYEFNMSIYKIDKRYPRILADEFYCFSDMVYLDVRRDISYFSLQKIREDFTMDIWYKNQSVWERAERTESGFRIPAEIFVYTMSTVTPITEGDSIIAFTDTDMPFDEKACRELNVHIW